MKLTIGTKLGGLCLLMIAVLIILGTVSHWNVITSIENQELVKHTFIILNENQHIPDYVWEAESAMRGLFLTGKPEYYQQHQEAVRNLEKSFEHVNNLVQSERPRQLVPTMGIILNDRLRAFEEVHQAYLDGKMEGAIAYIKEGKPIKMTRELLKVNNEINKLEQDILDVRKKELEISNKRLQNLIVFGIPLAVLLIGITGFLLTRSIIFPLKELTLVAEGISRGHLSQRPARIEQGDEIGVLSTAFSRMNDYLRGMSLVAQALAENDLTVTCTPVSPQDSLGNAFVAMIANLRGMGRETQEAARLISASATQIAVMSSQLAASSAETAAAVNETSTTVEEIKVTAQLVNQKASFVSESAQDTAQMALAGHKSVGETITGMDKIRRQMDFIAEGIVKLSEQSMSIGEIIATVNDLAGQSNLLAVNASIEAAKAGEHGKGFAVVAQEMRSLAEQSRQATEQVRRILNDIQKAISSAVMATEQGGKTVEAGVRQTIETESSIQSIEQGADGTVQAAAQILASTNEQVAGLNQVALAMENIRAASDQIVLSTRQSENSTSELTEMGKKLRQLVERFKVG